MRVRFALGVAVVVALGLLGAGAEAVRRMAAIPTLGAVETLDDLLATKPIPFEGGRAWAGISSMSIDAGEPLMIYVLAERTSEPSKSRLREREWRQKADAIGPLRIRGRSAERRGAAWDEWRGGREKTLFLTTATFSSSGEATLELEDGKGSLVARAALLVGARATPPFLALECPADGTCVADDPVECATNTRAVSILHVDGELPLKPLARLPRPLEDIALRLDVKDDRVTVSSRDADMPLTCRGSFAARWWVNGEPYMPSGAKPEVTPYRTGGGFLSSKHRFHLHMDPHLLGARPGDRIGLQVVYAGGMLPRLTNRVDFTLP